MCHFVNEHFLDGFMGGNISSVNLLTTKTGHIKALEFYRVQLHKQILNVFSHPSLILEGGQVTGIGWCCSVRISQTLIRQGKMIIPNYPSV